MNNIRKDFPALENFKGYVFADAAGGTQVPNDVINSICKSFYISNSNIGGNYIPSQNSLNLLRDVRNTVAIFLNGNPNEITFGPSMTSIAWNLSTALKEYFKNIDGNICVNKLDHDSNISPWVDLTINSNLNLDKINVNMDCTINMEHLLSKINSRTRLVALSLASNLTGTITDCKSIIKQIKSLSSECIVIVDAVHYAPHRLIDVKDIGCDFLFCSPYKF